MRGSEGDFHSICQRGGSRQGQQECQTRDRRGKLAVENLGRMLNTREVVQVLSSRGRDDGTCRPPQAGKQAQF